MNELKRFISDKISSTISRESYDLLPLSIDYIIDLASSFMLSDRLSREGMPVLAYMLRDASIAAGSYRFELFRGLGDTSLFLAGFFSPYVAQTGGTAYYIDMGAMAYGHASMLSDHLVLNELSKKFESVVGMLNGVSLGMTHDVPSIECLYEVHTRGPSKASLDALLRQGLFPLSKLAQG